MVRVGIEPRRWSPPAAPADIGEYAPTGMPARIDLWTLPVMGPEDPLIDPDGRLLTGTADGTIWSLTADSAVARPFANTGGRPLGLEWHPDGWVVLCDARRGLLRLDPDTGRVDVLVDSVDGRHLRFTNNAAVAADGTVYFTDSSRHGIDHFKADLLEHSRTGRLLRRSADGVVELVLDGLAFANGVALAPDDSFLLVAETGAYRVRRLWLTGPRAGDVDILLSNLPGLPDNLSTGESGLFWMALPSDRNALLDRLLPLPGILRQVVWAMPERIQPDASRVLFVVGFDSDGVVRTVIRAPGERFHYVTGVREHDGWLYLGSLVEHAVARVPVPAIGHGV